MLYRDKGCYGGIMVAMLERKMVAMVGNSCYGGKMVAMVENGCYVGMMFAMQV